MGVRSGIGGSGFAGRLRGRLFALAVIGLGCTPALWLPASARDGRLQGIGPLQHHATVINGGTIGSAFALADGLAVTNAHVVRGLAPGAPVKLQASGGRGGRVVARLVATSARMDLAVLAVPSGFLPAVAASDAPRRTGVAVVAAGVDASGARRDLPRMELRGTVIAPSRHVPAYGPGLVARVPGVRPGFSGGPLLDASGRLVGMVTAIRPGPSRDVTRSVAASGFTPRGAAPRQAEEAYVLGAAELRAEVRRLLAAHRP